jgi:hypothetical protein
LNYPAILVHLPIVGGQEVSMASIWLAALLLGTGFAIATGPGAKWKALNVVIILCCMGLGLGLGHALGLGSKNFGVVPHAAIPFSMMFGVLGAMTCVARNTWSAKG